MLGNSQVTGGGETQFFEFIQLVETDRGIVYRPWLNAKNSVNFVLIESSPTQIVFENPAHDFPQRIVYEYDGKEVLTARIEKLDRSKARSFAMRAVPCGGEAHRAAIG